MRKVIQVAVRTDNSVLAVCVDGSLWQSKPWEMGVPQWVPVRCPPEGSGEVEPLSLDEQAEKLAKAGGRKMIIGRGIKHET